MEEGINLEKISNFFSILGTLLSFLLNISPGILIWKIIKEIENYHIIPESMLITNIICREIWACYWKRKKVIIPGLSALTGTFIASVFLFIYLYYFTEKNKKKWLCFFIIEILFELFLYILLCVIIQNTEAVGYMAMIFNIAMYITPGQNILKVIKTKNYKLIPIWTTLIGVFCSFSWFLFGVLISNINTIVPNFIGIFFSIANSVIWCFYYQKNKIVENDGNKFKNVEIKNIPVSKGNEISNISN